MPEAVGRALLDPLPLTLGGEELRRPRRLVRREELAVRAIERGELLGVSG